nr:hypothetical protein [Blautia sp.]
MVQGGRGGKFRDPTEVVVIQIVRSVQAAAGKERVLDAGCQGVPEAYFPVEVVHLFQEAALRVIGQIPQVFRIGFLHDTGSRFHQAAAQILQAAHSVLFLQRGNNSRMVFFPHFPQIRHPCAAHGPGIGHVKDIFQSGSAVFVFMDQGDALGTCLYPPAHFFIPQFHRRAGRGIRPLCIDQELIFKLVLIEP